MNDPEDVNNFSAQMHGHAHIKVKDKNGQTTEVEDTVENGKNPYYSFACFIRWIFRRFAKRTGGSEKILPT